MFGMRLCLIVICLFVRSRHQGNRYSQGTQPSITLTHTPPSSPNSSLAALQTDGSYVALFNMFVERVRDQLHLVLAFSPIGDAFRDRLRRFPAIVNCCTIDWFQVRRRGW